MAEALDMSIASVHRIAHAPMRDVEGVVREVKKRLSARYWLLTNCVLSRIDQWDLGKASLKEKAVAAAVLTDKALLLDGGRPADNEPPEPKHCNTQEAAEDTEIEEETGSPSRSTETHKETPAD